MVKFSDESDEWERRARPVVDFSQKVSGAWTMVTTNYSDRNVRYVSDKGTLTLCKETP